MPMQSSSRPVTFILDSGKYECRLSLEEISEIVDEPCLEQLEFELVHDMFSEDTIVLFKLIEYALQALGVF